MINALAAGNTRVDDLVRNIRTDLDRYLRRIARYPAGTTPGRPGSDLPPPSSLTAGPPHDVAVGEAWLTDQPLDNPVFDCMANA